MFQANLLELTQTTDTTFNRSDSSFPLTILLSVCVSFGANLDVWFSRNGVLASMRELCTGFNQNKAAATSERLNSRFPPANFINYLAFGPGTAEKENFISFQYSKFPL